MMTSDVLDELFEQFEELWDASRVGPKSIREFVDELSTEWHTHRHLLLSLAQIDMEMAWVNWDRQLENMVKSASPNDLLEHFGRLPKAGNYFELIDSTDVSPQRRNQLARTESDCRRLFGDCIGESYFRHNYGLEIEQHAQDATRSVSCKFLEATNLRDSKFTLRGKSVFGRQRSTDSQSIFAEELADGMRIVIAGREESDISREQLVCQLVSPKYAVISNLSSVNPIFFVTGHKLACGDAVTVSFPFIIKLPRRLLSFA